MLNSVAIGVKANARYTCHECGSTELIQAHHKIPGNDDSLVSLCAECHSKKHSDVPKALFFNHRQQPYWHNKSASSLARELGAHPRTIIRAAKRLEILPGELSQWDEELIRNNIGLRGTPLGGWGGIQGVDIMEAKDIKKLRKKLGLTQKELAARVKVDALTVSRWERGEQRPSTQARRWLKRLVNNARS